MTNSKKVYLRKVLFYMMRHIRGECAKSHNASNEGKKLDRKSHMIMKNKYLSLK